MNDALHPLDRMRAAARRSMPASAWAYLDGAAVDERTARQNCSRYTELTLLPRVCVDVSDVDTSCTLLGAELSAPILLAPVALQKLFHPDGERGTLAGAAAAGVLPVFSLESSVPVGELGSSGTPFWSHLYIQRDRGLTRDLIAQAEEAGAGALVVTLDTPVPGIRYRQDAAMLRLPEGVHRANLPPVTGEQLTGGLLDPSVTWADIEWLVAHTRLPVVGKGVLHPDDARLACSAGVAAVVVSNHGGRNLDTVAATVDCLPGVAAAVAGRVPVLVDGGVRRGTDILKALALGASAVLVGRPYVWGLATNGAQGVRDVVDMLHRELSIAMALCGAPSLDRTAATSSRVARRGGAWKSAWLHGRQA
ncbi:alpha-hydroxy acid oxidase [Streptomyces sp. BH055]|uniref:alpha-hydroxy acid oxidase n=1 Tax=Streptomyces sp. BH055 TaxID=3401173 RepID=UPI003BB75E50